MPCLYKRRLTTMSKQNKAKEILFCFSARLQQPKEVVLYLWPPVDAAVTLHGCVHANQGAGGQKEDQDGGQKQSGFLTHEAAQNLPWVHSRAHWKHTWCC